MDTLCQNFLVRIFGIDEAIIKLTKSVENVIIDIVKGIVSFR